MGDGGVEEVAALGQDLVGGGAGVWRGDVVEVGDFRERSGFGGGGGAGECASTHHHHLLHNLSQERRRKDDW